MEARLSDLYQLEDMRENSSDNSRDNSPPSTTFNTSISSPKRSRRAIQKRVVTFPIKDVEGSRFKGDCTPPSDSWAWRKYGQKPIKGSPYPRGYYRCSSSKGCPARKQVERSRTDPNTLVVTYSYEHNHPWPASRNHQNRQTATTTTTTTTTTALIEAQTVTTKINQIDAPKLENNNFSQPVYIPNNSHIIKGWEHSSNNARDPIRIPSDQQNQQPMESLIVPNTTDDLGWFSDHQHQHNHQQADLDTSFLTSCEFSDLDMAKIFPMREEDESLFADLGELPECSLVFRQAAGGEEQRRPCGLTAPWCGASTG